MIINKIDFNNVNIRTIYFIVIILSIVFSFNALINPQLHGEDEATTFIVALNLLNNLKNFEIFNFFKSIMIANHPPARYLLPIPFLEIFGESIVSMRIPYFFLWIGSCVLTTKIAFKIGGSLNAILAGVFLSISGLFNLEILSLSHGATVFFGLLLINEILKSKINEDYIFNKKFRLFKINIIFLIGFIFFSSWSVIIFGFYFFLFLNYLKKKDPFHLIINLFLFTLPFFLFYLFYYLIFIGFPFWITNLNGLEIFNNFFNKNITFNLDLFGQLHQYILRAENSSLNIKSLIINIRVINWAYMPVIGPILFIFGIINVYKKHKNIFFILFFYLFLFNFYLKGQTGQHVQTIFIMLFAFSINELINYFKNKKFLKYLVFIKLVFLIITTYNFNLKIYNETNFPYHYQKFFFSSYKWPQNLVRPLDQIASTLRGDLKKEIPILNLIDGSLSLYHGRDLNWIYEHNLDHFYLTKNNCYIFEFGKYSAIVASKKLINICEDKRLKFIEFENSYLYIAKSIIN